MVQKEDGTLTGDDKAVRSIFLNYFRNLYSPIRMQDETATAAQEARHEVFQQLDQNPLQKIPQTGHQRIISLPDYHEVKRVLFELGPDKSPGPDGLTARFFQQNWHVVGSDVVAQIKLIFQNEEIPDDWLKGYVTLIPKNAEPLTPAEYRPISVGNIIYRLVMKLVANRLRPFLKKIISKEQTAFLQGRCIADNILLVKEILHSFSQLSFKQHAFLMKADINKAFDKLDWQFMKFAMQYLNVPTKIINIMLSAYSRSKITININGKGDGFLTPTQGLRQGCPMSPYVFIISMEIFSRMLQGAMRNAMINGVKVAKTSPHLTHVVYADDLILMGEVREAELQIFGKLLDSFALASGLCINPQKSGVWFSRACTVSEIDRVKVQWQARRVHGEERYLGIMIGQKGDIKNNGRRLLEKIRSKLTGWKSQLLSHAGRLVLIKSVLMSLPVYAMTLEMLPKGIIKEINSLMAKFFWGKLGQDRYMAFVGWQKVCKPIEIGGLGVKDLDKFGEALFMKVVWALMADEDKIWVQICKSKYYPTVGFWRAKNTGGCSKMWGQVVKKREFFQNQVQWKLGNGRKVNAISQPWFPNWNVQGEATIRDRKLKVCSLLQEDTGDWNIHELTRLFQPYQIQTIVGEINKPGLLSDEVDCLVWHKAKNGKYIVKEGYKELTQEINETVNEHDVEWQVIWKCKNISPKVKVFLWRLLHKGLPLGANMHARIQNYDPICQRCHQESEYEMHCIFFCNTSRQVWFGSQLGVRVHELSLNIATTVIQIMKGLNEDDSGLFANIMWEIWKERNKTVIENRPFKPHDVLQRVKMMGASTVQVAIPFKPKPHSTVQERYEYSAQGWQVVLDASWDITGRAGGAFVIYDRGCLHSIGLCSFEVHDAFHAEAVILREAGRYMYEHMNIPSVIRIQFFSDCMSLVLAVNHGEEENLPSWRATRVVKELIGLLEDKSEGMSVHHVQRKAVGQAHGLANVARRNRINYLGAPHMVFHQEARLNQVLDELFFQRVPDAPP
ncbi:RNA-directed DNA polymerase (reverse transcriptase)-related family protein [Rhynchospora pubera]|uniref:RNA-directed DNA polymerase (Reverse transcriptase)-related family protein n=1 Tax=Rhynchospora pubera TaxID=906938 RepID=A0AAV8CM15_9POAL|nr:RNA-directed DNA polymerase (reverse transcriptase)-related family protein [Rhynchospora pubera]